MNKPIIGLTGLDARQEKVFGGLANPILGGLANPFFLKIDLLFKEYFFVWSTMDMEKDYFVRDKPQRMHI